MRLQVIYTKTLESPRLFRRKTLNTTQGKGVTPLATKEQSCKRGTVGARGASGIKIILTLLGDLRVWDGWLQLGERIHAELCHRSSVYSAEAGVRTGPHASLGVRSLIRRSPQEHLDRSTRWSVFARARAHCHRCGAWYRLTKLLQTGWLTRWVWRN